MSVWNKVLLVLIFLCAAGFVYLGSDALKLRRDSRKKIQDAQTALKSELEKNRSYLNGTGPNDSYASLVNDVNRIRKIRGVRIWPHCQPQSAPVVAGTKITFELLVDAKPESPLATEGEISEPVTPESNSETETQVAAVPLGSRILPGSVVYLFDTRETDQGGCFLGQFSVDNIKDNVATLANSYLMTPQEIECISDSVAQSAPWAVYTVLPKNVVDSAENVVAAAGTNAVETETDDIEATDTDETLAVASQETVKEPQDTVAVEVDPSLALAQEFVSLNLERMQLYQHIELLKMQISQLEGAKKPVSEIIDFYQQEITDSKTLVQKARNQLDEVEKLHSGTAAEIKKLEETVANLKAMNKKMLADLTNAQINASEAINSRDASFSMAQ
jgi:hypothetical protein